MKRSFYFITIIVAVTGFSLALHSQLPPTVPITEEFLSPVANTLSFVGTVTLYFLAAYALIGALYLKVQSRLPGNKLTRPLLFGGLVGGIWWVGMIESVFALNTEFLGEFLTGLLDFLPILVLPVVLSLVLVRDKAPGKKISLPKGYLAHLGVFLIILVVGRWGRYALTPGYGEPLGLTLWTSAFALMIGLNFVFLKDAFQGGTWFKSALNFTLVTFGAHYLLFVYFLPLIFKDMFWGITGVFLHDLFLVFTASAAALWLSPAPGGAGQAKAG